MRTVLFLGVLLLLREKALPVLENSFNNIRGKQNEKTHPDLLYAAGSSNNS